MDRITVVDLFSGIGGLSLGLQQAGLDVVKAYDKWNVAVDTYRANFSHEIVETEITSNLDAPCADIYVGGPPCQGFSSAGLRRSDDERNTLVGEFSRLVASKLPQAFVFENVEGFLTGCGGEYVFELLEPLIEAGYRVHVRKINAANYGVPQLRKRVIVIGTLGRDPSFPSATHAAYGAPGAHLANRDHMIPTPTLAEGLSELPAPSLQANELDHQIIELSDDDLERARLLKPGQRMRDLPEHLWHESYRRRAFRRVKDGTPTERRGGAPSGIRRLADDEPSKAITGGALRDFLYPSQNRPLTIRECATLQTFPVHFRFLGSRSDKIQAIGNAVPPILGAAIGASLIDDLAIPEERMQEGRLLSFLPTFSDGMSPALASLTERVKRRFGMIKETQGLLWD